MNSPRRDRLGRGLGALLGEVAADEPGVESRSDVRSLALTSIRPNPLQPRREFTPEELRELAQSIDQNGLLQPILVRPQPGLAGRYELVAGERRLRAVTALGWSEVPAMIREIDDRTLLVLALVENLQREALGPLEEAEGYQNLHSNFGLSQAEIAEAVGKSRSTVANMLRLLSLPPSVRKLLEEGLLTTGHARALLAISDPLKAGDLARQAVSKGWTVREVERRAKGVAPKVGSKQRVRPVDPIVAALERALEESLSTRVTLRRGRSGKGLIEIPFHDEEEFERIFALIAGQEAGEVIG